MLHLERDWKMADDARHQTFQTFHQTSAIAEARRALEHPETLVAIEMFTVIAKLAKAAVSAFIYRMRLKYWSLICTAFPI